MSLTEGVMLFYREAFPMCLQFAGCKGISKSFFVLLMNDLN